MNKTEIQEYIGYYNIENYLFDKVSKNFKKYGYLTPLEFFAIVIWKSNRSKSIVYDGIKRKSIRDITQKINKETSLHKKLDILLEIQGIGIPIASAILSVCYPNDFTIVDIRAKESLKELNVKINGDPSINKESYFEYIGQCKLLAKKYKLSSLRQMDKYLWGKSFYSGKDGLKNFTLGLK